MLGDPVAPGMIWMVWCTTAIFVCCFTTRWCKVGRRQCVTAANLATGSSSSRSRWQELTGNDATGGFWKPGTQHLQGTDTGQSAGCTMYNVHCTGQYHCCVQKCPVSNTNSGEKHSGQVRVQFATRDETNNRYYTFPPIDDKRWFSFCTASQLRYCWWLM